MLSIISTDKIQVYQWKKCNVTIILVQFSKILEEYIHRTLLKEIHIEVQLKMLVPDIHILTHLVFMYVYLHFQANLLLHTICVFFKAAVQKAVQKK